MENMKLPLIGLGTWNLRGEECVNAVKMALEIGYRHIDTAHLYDNHREIAKGKKGFDRKKLYITSKIDTKGQIDPAQPDKSVIKSCEQALQELETDYIDLYLIHYPNRTWPLDEIFESLEKLIEQGKIKKAGVSNYTIHHLEDLLKSGFIPFANQVEFHPYLNQVELLNYCRKHGIELISMRSFGKGKLLAVEPLFELIGSKYHKTGAQVILRWLIQKQIPVIPKASSKKHLEENFDIFDFTLTPEEMHQIDQLNRNKRYCQPDDPEHLY